MSKDQISINRKNYLDILRSGKYKKGTTKSDEKGNPIIESEEDNDGACACAIMIHELSPRGNFLEARNALGISAKQCTFIQTQLNDSPLTFPEIADRIEKEVFK